MGNRITRHTELQVYQRAFEAAMVVFGFTKGFPKEEVYSLTDQVRRSSRSVCANLTEAWRKRRYPAAFVSKLNDAEAEAAETQTWIEFAVRCEYISSRRSKASLQGIRRNPTPSRRHDPRTRKMDHQIIQSSDYIR